MLKPNGREATRAIQAGADGASTARGVRAAGRRSTGKAGQPVFLTLGADGILAFHQDGPTPIPAVPSDRPD